MKRFIALIAFFSFTFASDQIPASQQDHAILIKDVTIHPVSGPTIANGMILFSDGKIMAMGNLIAQIPDGTEEISLPGKHIYPSLIAANTVMGLVEGIL